MIFLPNAAWVSFPLSTLTENATTHFLCVITGANFSVAPLLTASVNVAVFLFFFPEPLCVGVPDPFFRSDPFIASKFAVLPSPGASAGDEASLSDRVFLLRLECSSSELLRGDFLDFFIDFSRFPLWSPSPPLFDLALYPSAVGSSERSPSPPVRSFALSSPPLFLPTASIGVPSRFGGGTRVPVPKLPSRPFFFLAFACALLLAVVRGVTSAE